MIPLHTLGRLFIGNRKPLKISISDITFANIGDWDRDFYPNYRKIKMSTVTIQFYFPDTKIHYIPEFGEVEEYSIAFIEGMRKRTKIYLPYTDWKYEFTRGFSHPLNPEFHFMELCFIRTQI